MNNVFCALVDLAARGHSETTTALYIQQRHKINNSHYNYPTVRLEYLCGDP